MPVSQPDKQRFLQRLKTIRLRVAWRIWHESVMLVHTARPCGFVVEIENSVPHTQRCDDFGDDGYLFRLALPRK